MLKLKFILVSLFLLLFAGCVGIPGEYSGIVFDSINFSNNGSIYDNENCTIIKSPSNNPNITNYWNTCNNNSLHGIVNGLTIMNVTPQGVEATFFYGDGRYITNINSSGNGTLWVSNTTSLTPLDDSLNVYFDKNVTIAGSLTVLSGESIHLGNNITMSEQEVFFSDVNSSQNNLVVNSGFLSIADYNGSKLLSNLNTNLDPLALAITSAGDPSGNGMALFKRNLNHIEPYLGQVLSLKGNMDVMTTFSNNGSMTGSNTLCLGFYRDLTVLGNNSFVNILNRTCIIKMNQTQINISLPVHFEGYTSYNLSILPYPVPVGNEVLEYFKQNGKKYMNSVARGERRYVDSGAGSFVFDEEMIINNDTTLNGSISFPLLSDGYLCISGGVIYSNVGSCP